MSNRNSKRSTARACLGIEDRWVENGDGRWHMVREADGEHNLTVCGKYVRGTAKHEAPWARFQCVDCLRRFDVGHIIEEPDATPVIVKRGKRRKSARHNGRNIGGVEG